MEEQALSELMELRALHTFSEEELKYLDHLLRINQTYFEKDDVYQALKKKVSELFTLELKKRYE